MTSRKQAELVELYKQMNREGIKRESGPRDYSIMNIRGFKNLVLPIFREHQIESVLDYGSGSTSWDDPSFSEGLSAKQFFQVSDVCQYEPSLYIDERSECDAVVCFDVLEHIFLADVPATVWELFSLAKKLVVVNVACYPASARLPNGENAHITVRPPLWWKGMFDAIAPAFPDITFTLYASTAYMKCTAFTPQSFKDIVEAPLYTRPLS